MARLPDYPENAFFPALYSGIYGHDLCGRRHRLLDAALLRLNRGEGNLGTVTMTFGGITVVAGCWRRWPADGSPMRCARFPGSYFLVSGAGMLLAFPLLLAVLVTPFPWAYGVIFLTVFCLFFNTGPVNAIIANVTNPAVRPARSRLVILIIHLFGDAFSPTIIGLTADLAKDAGAAAAAADFVVDETSRKQPRNGLQLLHRLRS